MKIWRRKERQGPFCTLIQSSNWTWKPSIIWVVQSAWATCGPLTRSWFFFLYWACYTDPFFFPIGLQIDGGFGGLLFLYIYTSRMDSREFRILTLAGVPNFTQLHNPDGCNTKIEEGDWVFARSTKTVSLVYVI